MSSTTLEPAAVWKAILAIPKGQTASYGMIAMRAGFPGRSRWVARLLSTQQGPKGLPWHRVIKSDGRIAFPADDPNFIEQVQRLRAEGVSVKDGRVATQHRSSASTLDELLWG